MQQSSHLKGKCASTTNRQDKEKNFIKCNASCQHDLVLGEVTDRLYSQWQGKPDQYILYLPISLKASIPMHAHTLKHTHKHKAKTWNVEAVG